MYVGTNNFYSLKQCVKQEEGQFQTRRNLNTSNKEYSGRRGMYFVDIVKIHKIMNSINTLDCCCFFCTALLGKIRNYKSELEVQYR